eukprot:436968-Prymnesium_polylepis.1
MQVFALCGRASAWYAQACLFGHVRGRISGRWRLAGGPKSTAADERESESEEDDPMLEVQGLDITKQYPLIVVAGSFLAACDATDYMVFGFMPSYLSELPPRRRP